MEQKAVIKLEFKKEKDRSKALKVVVSAHQSCGRIKSVGWKESDDTVELVGNGVDIVKVVKLIRKKLGGATIISLAPVEKKEKKPEEESPPPPPCVCCPPGYPYGNPVILYDPCCHDFAPAGCSIL